MRKVCFQAINRTLMTIIKHLAEHHSAMSELAVFPQREDHFITKGIVAQTGLQKMWRKFTQLHKLSILWASLMAQWWRIHLKCGRCGFDPWVGKMSWRRKWQPTPIFLPWRIPWTEEPGGLQSMGLQRVRHDWVTKTAWCSSDILDFGLLTTNFNCTWKKKKTNQQAHSYHI